VGNFRKKLNWKAVKIRALRKSPRRGSFPKSFQLETGKWARPPKIGENERALRKIGDGSGLEKPDQPLTHFEPPEPHGFTLNQE
jgi:hypothetical protein